MKLAEILDELERFAPRDLVADWDNVGLLLGDRSAEVQRVLTCLTVTPESAADAIDHGAQLLLSHHPVLFRPVRRLTTDTSEGRMLLSLLQAGVAVVSLHTAFDDTQGGINDLLAQRLGLSEVRPLIPLRGPAQCKIVVFVTESDLPRVSQALFEQGAGQIGNYSQVSYRTSGTGAFLPGEGANPTLGVVGQREEVNEWRLEVLCPEHRVSAAIQALRRAHSYEEPAFDVYPLRAETSLRGAGRLGELPEPVPFLRLAQTVRAALGCGPVQCVGEEGQQIRRVAIACGAAGERLPDAIRAGADLFLTGEMRFHDYLSAQAQGIALCLPGHYATERFAVEELAARLQQRWPGLVVTASTREVDPVQWV